MKQKNLSHRNAVNYYLQSDAQTPIKLTPLKLSDTEVAHFSALLARLVGEIGNLSWLMRIFLHSLDIYWSKVKASKEIALEYEGTIGRYMQQVVIARQFSRIPISATNTQIDYDSVTITGFDRFWHPYYDHDLPHNLENFNEPYLTLYSLLKFLSNQLLATANRAEAMKFLASLLGAFTLSYPNEYLNTDQYFQKYLENEVLGTPVNDDYTYYLCRVIDYSLFDRS
jgi:hypothetical protein